LTVYITFLDSYLCLLILFFYRVSWHCLRPSPHLKLGSMLALHSAALSTPQSGRRIFYQSYGRAIHGTGSLSLRIPRTSPLITIANRGPQTTSVTEARRQWTTKATGDALLPSFRLPILIMADKKGGRQATLGYVRDSQSTIGCVAVGYRAAVIETIRHYFYIER
jgi:hypothetical protein